MSLSGGDIVLITSVACVTVFLSVTVMVCACYRCAMAEHRRKRHGRDCERQVLTETPDVAIQPQRTFLVVPHQQTLSEIIMDLPPNPATWSCDEAANWVAQYARSGAEAAKLAKKHRIDGHALLTMSQQDMETGLHLTVIGDRLHFQSAQAQLRDYYATIPPETLAGSSTSSLPSSSAASHEPPAYK